MDINALTREIADSLGLAEAARSDAAAGIPAPDAETPTSAENGAIAAAQQTARRQIEILEELARQTEDAMPACNESLREARRQRQNANDGAPPESDLGAARAARDNAAAAYNKFKHDNGLIRDASGDDRLAQFAWAVAIVAAEGAVNSLLFRHAFSGGLAEGFIAAFFIGLVNVGFAFVGGALCLRYAANHCKPAVKLGGLCGFLLCISVCAGTVAMAAWFRGEVDLLRGEDMDAADIAALAWRNALDNFLGADIRGLFASLNGFLLVSVGVLCAMGGVWKGYEYDDPYPGFGDILRQKENAEEFYLDAQQAHDTRLLKWRKNSGGGMRRADDELQNAAGALKTAMRGMRRAADSAAALPDTAAVLAGGLLSAYRAQNAKIRAAAAPSYFSRYPQGEEFSALERQSAPARDNAEKLRAAAELLLAECEEERRQIWKALERAQIN